MTNLLKKHAPVLNNPKTDEEVVLNHLRYIIKHAQPHMWKAEQKDDCLAEALYQFWKAMLAFDSTKGAQVGTLARKYIKYGVKHLMTKEYNQTKYWDKYNLESMPTEDAYDIYEHNERIEKLQEALRKIELTDRQRVILEERFFKDKQTSRVKLAKRFNVTHQRIEQIEAWIVTKLKKIIFEGE